MKTRFEQIKNMSDEEMTRFLCDFLQTFVCKAEQKENRELPLCECCCASKFCHRGHTGFKDWLNERAEI